MEFLATLHGKRAIDGIGGTFKRSVWRPTFTGCTAPCDAASYAEFTTKRNLNINVIYVPSAEIEEKSAEMVTTWKYDTAVPNTQMLQCIEGA